MSGDIKKDGGPAFPIAIHPENIGWVVAGLTKREWYAGMALMSGRRPSNVDIPLTEEGIAEICFKIADAMLWESEKKIVTAHEINKMFPTGCSCKQCESAKGEAGG